jgi:hypothetical protein
LPPTPDADPGPGDDTGPHVPRRARRRPPRIAITSAIRPALGKAATDYEQPWHDNCLGWKATTVPVTSSKCIYGNPSGTYTVALVGDSHASALFPGVNAVAKAHGWKLIPYLKIDCSFLDLSDLIYYGPPSVPYPECDDLEQRRHEQAPEEPAGPGHHLDEPLDLHGQYRPRRTSHDRDRNALIQDDQEDPATAPRS